MPVSKPQALSDVEENRLLSRWGELLPRRPDQLNALHEADAELVPWRSGTVLAATVDTVAEELASGLYRQPFTAGWVAVTAGLSDLAAVGARPLGLLLAVTLPERGPEAFQRAVGEGVAAACARAGTFVLGGDTNVAAHPAVTVTALGQVDAPRRLTRLGASIGDEVYATGRLGLGAAMAAAGWLGVGDELFSEGEFRPVPRLEDGAALAGLASACMDTSDGLVATLDQLARLNGVGFEVDRPLEELLHPRVWTLCQTLGVDPLVALAQIHGEYELVFTVPPSRRPELERKVAAGGLAALRVGTVVAQGLHFTSSGRRTLDGAALRNAAALTREGPAPYLAELVRLVSGP